MKKLSLIFLSLLCVCSLHAQENILDFLKQDMNKSMRDYCYHIQEAGFELYGETDGALIYIGTVAGVPETNVLVYGTPDQKKVATVALQFPAGQHWRGKSDYDYLRDLVASKMGSPHKEQIDNAESMAVWRYSDVMVIVTSDSDGSMFVVGNVQVEDEWMEEDEAPKAAEQQDDEEVDKNSEIYCQAALKSATEAWEESGRTDRDYLLAMLAYAEKLGGIYGVKGWYTTAVNYYKKAQTYAELYSGKYSDYYVGSVYNLYVVYADMSDLENAGRCIEEFLALIPYVTFEKPIHYFIFLRAAITHYETLGQFAEAEAMFGRAMNDLPRLTGNEYAEILTLLLHDRSTLAMRMGNRKEAKEWLEREEETLRQFYTEPDARYALWYAGYGAWYGLERQFEKAEEMFLRALPNLVGLDEREKGIYEANIYDNLGMVYAYMDRPDDAIVAVQRSMEAYKEIYTSNHPKYANALTNLAYAYSKKKNYHKAIQYTQEAERIFELLLGPEHPSMMLALYNEGSFYSQLAKYDEAERLFRQSIGIAKKNYQRALDYMSEYQREQFWQTCMELMEQEEITHFIFNHYAERPTIPDFAYDNELFSKGLLLASTEMVRRSIEESGDQALIARYEQLSRLKERIYFMELNGKASHELDSCRQVADALEKEVTRQSAAFRQNADIWTVTWKDVRAALRPHQLAIEFTRIPLSEDSAMYAALLLRSGDAHPRMVPLFEEKEVTAILQTTDPDTQYDFSKGGWILFRPIWSKLLQYMHYGDTVYCAATGVLHQIAIENLPFNAEQTIGALFQIERVSSTRELVHAHHAEQPHSAVLYGGIYYDMEMDDLLAQSESYSDLAFASTRAVTDESLRAGVHYLPGTRYEVEMIRAILRPSALDTRVYTTSSANEESFKALSGQKKNILHVATHGFYWTDSTAREQRYFAQRMAQTGTSSATIDPLTRSGLLFAGSNIALRGHSDELPQSVQDGILTSKEISLLDLRGSEMVVLSACETGKGEVTGDGVFGLQRAFKMAGAQSILMSLWPVDDAATQLMMTEFYYYWIDRKMTKREAFLKAQASVKQQYTQPKYWAAFILLD